MNLFEYILVLSHDWSLVQCALLSIFNICYTKCIIIFSKETLIRIADTQVRCPSELQPPLPNYVQDPQVEPPPSYEEAMAISPTADTQSLLQCSRETTTSCLPQTYSELGEALQNLKIETKMQSVQVIFKVENVQIYFITPDGRVSAPSKPSQLRVIELEGTSIDCRH